MADLRDRSEIEVGRIKAGEVEGARRLLKEVFIETDAQKKDLMDEDFYNWQNISNNDPVIVARCEGEIVGHYSMTPLRFIIGGDTGKVAIMMDLVTKKEFRGRGVFTKMGKSIISTAEGEGYDFIYGFPNPNSLHGFIDRLGFTHLLTLPLWASPLCPSLIMEELIGFLPWRKILNRLDSIFLKVFKRGTRAFEIEEHDTAPDEIDELWEEVMGSAPLSLVRDSLYLTWRFVRRPNIKYRIWTAKKDGKLLAYVIYREGKFFGISAGLLMDFLAQPGKDGRKALISLIRKIKGISAGGGNGLILAAANKVRPYSPLSRDTAKILTRTGFFRVPNFINPRSLKMIVRPITERGKRFALEKKNWFLTLADWDVL